MKTPTSPISSQKKKKKKKRKKKHPILEHLPKFILERANHPGTRQIGLPLLPGHGLAN